MRRLRTILPILLAAIALCAANVRAADVHFRFSTREVFVGNSLLLQVQVTNPTDVQPPEPVAVDGAEMRLVPGENTSQQFRFVNGRSETIVTTTFSFEIRPTRAGRITIPPVSIRVDGKEYSSEATTIVASASDTADLLFVDLISEPASPMVGEETTLTLRIWIRPYRNPEFNTTLSESEMWQLVDLEQSKLGIFKQSFAELEQQRRRPRGEEVLRGDRAYFVYAVSKNIRPVRAGPPELGEIDIAVNWPTGVRQVRNFFGERSLQITGVRPIRSAVDAATFASIDVRPLPTEGQPPFFNGAVGRFVVDATAKPTQAAVGDPITLTFSVVSQGDAGALDGVQAPPFASMPELAEHFRIPTDPPAGSVQGRRKVFTQTFRPLSDGVTEIPAISFAFFDPRTARYETVTTKPISITVSPAERLNRSQIVGAAPDDPTRDATPLTTLAGGLLANALPSPALLRDERATLGPGLAVAVALPPLLCGVLFARRSLERRRAADPSRRRAAGAMRTALTAMERGRGTPDAIFTSVVGYIADRCDLPEGCRTRGDALAALADRAVDPDITSRAERLLTACERARYAPRADDAIAAEEARSLLGSLEQQPLRPLSATPRSSNMVNIARTSGATR